MTTGKYILSCNDDSRAAVNREKYVAKNGGEFVKSNRKWLWQETTPAPQPETAPAEQPAASGGNSKAEDILAMIRARQQK